jgi:hypothetical protein
VGRFRILRRRFRILRTLGRNRDGAVALEFAIVFPFLLLAFFGGIEMAIVLFISSTIEAAVFDASRYGITGGSDPGVTREDRVLEIVGDKTYGLVDMDKVSFETLVYDTFSDIGEPEPWEDIVTVNGAYDATEPFTDVNGNGVWDADMGAAGLGGPSDVVVYSISYSWGMITPIMRTVLGVSARRMSSVAVRNEPF